MAAVIFGAIAVGMLTEWAGRRGSTPLDVPARSASRCSCWCRLAFGSTTSPSFQLLSVLFTLVGTITGIEYAIVAQSMPRELTGRAATCLNLLIFVGAFLVQAGFGLVLGLWQPDGGRTIRRWPTGSRSACWCCCSCPACSGMLQAAFCSRPGRPSRSHRGGAARPPERGVPLRNGIEADCPISLQSEIRLPIRPGEIMRLRPTPLLAAAVLLTLAGCGDKSSLPVGAGVGPAPILPHRRKC
jgi:MFS family permease